MKYLLILLLAITTKTFAEESHNYYFKPIKVSNQKHYDYILDNLIISAGKAVQRKRRSETTSKILKDYDSVLRYKSDACEAYEINKTLEDFYKTNKEFRRESDKIRVDTFVNLAKLTELEISGCAAIYRTYWNNSLQKHERKK